MQLQRLSHKTLIVAVLLSFAALNIAHTLIAKRQFRDAALEAQKRTLVRVVEVATLEVMRNLHNDAYTLGNTLQRQLTPLMQRPVSDTALSAALQDPFNKGFVGVSTVDLEMLRVYDPQLQPLAQSSDGRIHLAAGLPAALRQKVAMRQGADRLKAVGVLWHSPAGALYSMLVPIGGLQLHGYLELVFDPKFNLGRVSDMIRLPLSILTPDGTRLLANNYQGKTDNLLPIRYTLRGDDDQPAFVLVAYENMANFYNDMHATQLNTTMLFLLLSLAALALSLWLLQRYLFQPVNGMLGRMEECIDGDVEISLDERGLKEVHRVAHAFNVLLQKVRESIGELQRISSLDALTGIANRRHFDIRFEQEWQRGIRNRTPLGLLMIDIDFFKNYNDSLGHQAGDHCIQMIARTLSECSKRPADLVARYGGEEFVVLLPDTDSIGTGVIALRVREAVAELALPHPASGVSDVITLSIGACVLQPAPQQDRTALVTAADAALYRAKNGGRDRIEFCHPDDLNGPAG